MESIAPPRIYADTSVFGGVFDQRFSGPSRKLFDQIQEGRFVLVTSVLVRSELAPGPPLVYRFFEGVFPMSELVRVSEEALRLRNAYVAAGIVPERWNADALHVALATVSDCSALVSWNFRHIVHSRKVPLYNAINEVNGFRPIAIHSPSEVIVYEDKEI